MAKASPVFYCIQSEDDMEHPNAFFVPKPDDGRLISFEAFLQHFPFNSDAFHFRFQVKAHAYFLQIPPSFLEKMKLGSQKDSLVLVSSKLSQSRLSQHSSFFDFKATFYSESMYLLTPLFARCHPQMVDTASFGSMRTLSQEAKFRTSMAAFFARLFV